MADTVNVQTVHKGARGIVEHWTNESDGTGESLVAKVDISTLTYPPLVAATSGATAATYSAVDRIEYSVWGHNYVALEWDHTVNDEIAILSGQGAMDWKPEGGLVDPRSAATGASTGDIVLTTDAAIDGAGYDITIWFRPKA